MVSPKLLADTCVLPSTNLGSWWRAEGNALDFASNYSGTITTQYLGTVQFSPSRVGLAFDFHGANYVDIPPFPLNSFTIECWLNPRARASASGGYSTVISDEVCGAVDDWGVFILPDGRIEVQIGDHNNGAGASWFTSAALIQLNTFTHVAVTRSTVTGKVEIYINGALDSSFNSPHNRVLGVANPTCDIYPNRVGIGNTLRHASINGALSAFDGLIDEVTVYNRVLATNEIQAVYGAGNAGKCIAPTAPFIISQPANQTVDTGGGVNFQVLADGTQPLSFQWSLNGTNIVGATNSALNLVNVQPAAAGSYFVEITNIIGTATSSNASLTVNPPPSCTPATSNLVGWWRGEGNALDFAGNNNGTLFGGMGFAGGKAGQAFSFDGVNDYVSFGNSAGNFGTKDFTIELWLKTVSTRPESVIEKWPTCGHSSLFEIRIGSSNPTVGPGRLHMVLDQDAAGNNYVDLISTKTVNDGVFHHLALVRQGTNVSFYIDGLLDVQDTSPGLTSISNAANLVVGRSVCVGVDETTYFTGQMDEISIYQRALTANEIQAIYAAQSAGKCAVPIAPHITTQPTNRTVLVGTNTTFSVTAGGSPTLLYQWSVNGTNIAGATNTSLMLTNVQFNQAGNYTVTVTNGGGFAISSNALFSVVFPPAVVRVVNTSGMAGSTVAVPVELLANGNENALGFSLSYNTNLLAFTNVVLGSGAGGAALIPNIGQTASGKVGVALALNSGSVFALGTQEVAVVNFAVVAPPSASNQTASVTFTDVPTTRQLVDAAAGNLAAYYTNGTVTITASDWEGDTAPRTNGNKQVLIEDWVQVGRFVAKLDVPNDGSEYQRADCAPRATLGNGILSITDWVQAGRYAAGLDPLTVVGGPTTEDTNAVPLVGGGKFQPKSVGRTLRVASRTVQAAVTNTVTVQLDALGNENAVGFSLNFNPAILQFVSASLGADAGNALSNLNTSAIGSGKLGVALALSTGVSWPAGTRELLKVNFAVAASATGTSNVAFGSNPIAAEISDAAANTLTATYASGVLTFSPYPPVLRANLAETNAVVAWPVVASNFVLQVNADPAIASSNWSNASENPAVIGEEKIVTITNITGTKFFRLYQP